MNLEQKDELYFSVYRAVMRKSREAAVLAANAAVKIVSDAEVKLESNFVGGGYQELMREIAAAREKKELVEEHDTTTPFMEIPSNTYLRILTVADVKEIVAEEVNPR